MEKYFRHKDIKFATVLMSYQRKEEGLELPKVIAIVTSSYRKRISESRSNYGEVEFVESRNNAGKILKNYYLFWGTDYDFNNAGYVEITTPKGRRPSLGSVLKTFNAAKNATEFVNFSRI